MKKLGLEVPEFQLRRCLVITTAMKPVGQVEVSCGGLFVARLYYSHVPILLYI